MGADRLVAVCLVLGALSACVCAQDSSSAAQPSSQTSSASATHSPDQSSQANEPGAQGESSSRRGRHHVRVQVEDEDSEPAELRNAEAEIDQQEYAAAAAHLQKFVETQPENYVGWFDLGFVENALGKVDDSIAAYRKSVAAKPDVFEANLNLGLQLAKTDQPDAETFLRAATQLKPTDQIEEGQYRAWLALAQVMEKSRPDEALQAYRKAARLQPKEAEPHLFMGQIFEHENKFADAEAEYKQAAALDPQSTDAVIGLANIYMRGRRFPQAEEWLRRLIGEDPTSSPAHIQLGRVLAAEGKLDAAISELQAGIKLAPGDPSAQLDLAKLYTSAGKNDLAEGVYRSLLASHANDAELHRWLGEALLREKKFTEAQQEFATAVKLEPVLGEAYGGLAFAAGENKDYQLVIRALDARAKLLPEVAITYFMRASAYDHLRDFKRAAANYRLFLNSANGKYPDEEWQAKHRLIAIAPKK
jgi:tetratricopeptide (TPR) repeat protein